MLNHFGIDEEVRYYFPDNEPIWFIGESLSDRKELNEALNRESIKIDTITEFIHQVSLSLVQDEPRASLIIMQNIPIDIKNNLSTLVQACNISKHVKVYEIGRDSLFKYGQVVPNIYKLKELSFEKTRSANIKTYDNPKDKQASIMKSLELDLDISRKKALDLEKEITNLSEEKEELIEKVKELSFDIDEKYLSKIKHHEDKIADLEEAITSLNIDLVTERDKSKSHSDESLKKTAEISELKYTIIALEKKMEEKESNIDTLKSKIRRLEEELEKVTIEKNKILQTTVDEESIVILNNNLEAERNLVRVKNEDINNLNVRLKEKEFDIKNLENVISTLRTGENDIANIGRTYNLDESTLNKTTLIYIKVFEELPYLKKYINILFDFLKVKQQGKGMMLVLKNDEGMDSEIFKGLGVLSTFNDIQVNTEKYRVFPSSTMFSGIENVDENYGFLLVVDYIKSKKYYLRSTSKEIYMTSVSHSKKIKEFDLKGAPISIDSESILDIKYNPSIAEATMPDTRDIFVKEVTARWYKTLSSNYNL